MSSSAKDKEGGKLPILNKRNWTVWIEHVGDFIMALEHEDAADIWEAYLWTPADGEGDDDDPAERDWQRATSVSEKKLRMKHNKAYKEIRMHLEHRIFNSTRGMENNVPKLLRFLKRKVYNDNSADDRNALRKELDNMQLEDYEDYDEYSNAFDCAVKEVQKFDLDLVDNDERLLYKFNDGLPAAWQTHIDIAGGQNLSFEQARAFYHRKAKNDSTLPGTLKIPAKTSQTVNFALNKGFSSPSQQKQNETCRQFARGRCQRGDDCLYEHPATHSQHQHETQDRPRRRAFQGDCYHCGKTGHRISECRAKKAEDADKQKSTGNRSHVAQEHKYDEDLYSPVTIDSAVYTLVEVVSNVAHGQKGTLRGTSPDTAGLRGTTKDADGHYWIYMCIDGASTCGVVESEAGCIEVRDTDIWIQTGGDGKPNMVHCTRTGTLPLDTVVDGKRVQMKVPVRIVPGFGTNILPEHYFLEKGFSVNKLERTLEVLTPDKKTVMRAQSHKHDKSCLFYAKLRVAQDTLKTPANKYINVDTTHFLGVFEGEAELQSLLPISDDYDQCYRQSCLVDSCFRTGEKARTADLVQLWHERLGHRNMHDVCALMQIPVPAHLPRCITCIKCKSKRRPLTGSDGLHDTVRPGYAFACDHAGPFRVKTWGGNQLFSLKADVHSGKLFGVMTNSTGKFYEEWQELVLRLQAHFGKQMVARLITDSAPYFLDRRLEHFNRQRGIVHVRSPPYTQELNGLCERTFGTLLAMARANLDRACAPEPAYGECLTAMCEVLDVCPHKTGGKLTRLEKWHGRLLPRQHDRIKVWGCAAYLHLDYGTRGKIGGLGKLDPRAELCMFVGYDPNGMGYRVAELPGFKIRTALHLSFVEMHFPCKTEINKELPAFMTDEQEQRYAAPANMLDDTGGRDDRPKRARTPSAAALENIAAGPACPPDEDVMMMIDLIDDIFCEHHDTVYSGTDCPRTVPEALAGPDAEQWLAALEREVQQHVKNETLGPPIDPKDLPPGTKAIPFDCLTKLKRCGTKKVRAIIKGFYLKQGLHYNETFAPVPCLGALRFFLALAAKLDWEAKQGDVNTAFLLPKIDSYIIVAVPNWFCEGATGAETGYTLRQVLKSVPGVPQGPRLWHNECKGIFAELKMRQCRSEFCLYYCETRKLYLVMWVDDIFLFFPPQAAKEALELWKGLQEKMDLDDWQDIGDCLGCHVTRDRTNRTLSLTQEPAIRKLLLRLNMHEAAGKETPMMVNVKLSKAQCPTAERAAVMTEEQRWYRSTVASLIYFVSWTRPDIAYAVSKLCKFMHNPGHDHIVALKRLLRYLKATADHGLEYNFSDASEAVSTTPGIYAYYDAAHADCPDTMKSTLAYVVFFSSCAISWHTKLHSFLTTSTNHSEYCAAAKCAREAKWWEKFAMELGMGCYVKPIDLYSDSQGAIAMTYNPVQRTASKHVDLADHYAREQQERGTITITYVRTHDMIADALTKPLGKESFLRHAAKLVSKVQL